MQHARAIQIQLRAEIFRPFVLDREVQDRARAVRVANYCRLRRERGYIFAPYSPPKPVAWLEQFLPK